MTMTGEVLSADEVYSLLKEHAIKLKSSVCKSFISHLIGASDSIREMNAERRSAYTLASESAMREVVDKMILNILKDDTIFIENVEYIRVDSLRKMTIGEIADRIGEHNG